jgi:hypothetical protein
MMTPRTDTTPYHGRFSLYFAGFLAALLVFAGTAVLSTHIQPPAWEVSVFHAVNNWSDAWRPAFIGAALFPQSLWIAICAVVIAFLLRLYRLVWRLAVCTVTGSAIVLATRYLIGHHQATQLLVSGHLRAAGAALSFPAGHMMIVTVIMLPLIPYLHRFWRLVVIIPMLFMAVALLYLGIDTPLSVLGGCAIGLGVVSCVRILPQSLKVALRLD